MPFALNQIAGRQKAQQKIPSWAAMEGLIYPPHISMEQCSSEQTACYKARLAERLVGDVPEAGMADLTGGFGVDFSFMARRFRKAVYVEQQQHLCEAARHNFELLGLPQAEVVCGDGPDAFTIFHSGDCNRHDHLKPKGRPDIFMGHCAINLDFLKAARETMPAKLFLTLHHQELGHIPGQYRCVAFEDEPLQRVRGLREAGFKAAMPVWGDRIV